MSILVVDDIEDNAEMLSRWLTRRGYETHTACDGREAVEKAIELHPDLIFMDISMPVMSGIEATRLIRSMPSIGTVPIIALTAHAMASDQKKCLVAGCTQVTTKPVDFADLRRILKTYFPERTQSERTGT